MEDCFFFFFFPSLKKRSSTPENKNEIEKNLILWVGEEIYEEENVACRGALHKKYIFKQKKYS